jgi:hypothetical protein
VSGRFGDQVDFGCGPLTARNTTGDAFVARLDGATSRPLWGKHVVVDGGAAETSIASDRRSSIALAISGQPDFGEGPIPGGFAIATLARGGSILWTRTFGVGADTVGVLDQVLRLASDGGVLLAGVMGGIGDFADCEDPCVDPNGDPCTSFDARCMYNRPPACAYFETNQTNLPFLLGLNP